MGMLRDEGPRNILRRIFLGKITPALLMRLILLAITTAILANGCVWINSRLGLPSDNILEEFVEDFLGTGDLTPASKEPKCEEAEASSN